MDDIGHIQYEVHFVFVSNNHAMGGRKPEPAEGQRKRDRIMIKTGCRSDPRRPSKRTERTDQRLQIMQFS
jgi:hypothetical protein